MCYVTGMDNVTGKCGECGKSMAGRADRKFCSAACRQKAYRASRNITANGNVTAEPFPIADTTRPAGKGDEFWGHVLSLPMDLGSLHDNGEGEEIEVLPVPPIRKTYAKEDTERWDSDMRRFLDQYDSMATNLARIKATVEAIVRRN